MIKHYGKLALVHGGISSIFAYILAFGEPNMFTLPVAMVFGMATLFCGIQYFATRTIEKWEDKYGNIR